MFNNTSNLQNSILAAFLADAYCLGSHWIYGADKVEKLNLNWDEFQNPRAMWHKGKTAGDFTHYGDQMLLLLESIKQIGTFDFKHYKKYWISHMQDYTGYIDGSTRESLKKLQLSDTGSDSSDLSICGRIAPLMIGVKTQEEFLKNVKDFVSMTHNSSLALDASEFFAKLLYQTLQGERVENLLLNLKSKNDLLNTWIKQALKSKNDNTSDTIEKFGPACGVDGGFAGIIHLLALNEDFQSTMIKNAKAGGDNSARAMVVAMILGAYNEIPTNLVDKLNNRDL